MAFAAVMSTSIPQAFSDGNKKIQYFTWSAASGDTSGTVTMLSLSSVDAIFMDGALQFTSAPTFSSNVATIAFSNPGATVYGSGFAVGK